MFSGLSEGLKLIYALKKAKEDQERESRYRTEDQTRQEGMQGWEGFQRTANTSLPYQDYQRSLNEPQIPNVDMPGMSAPSGAAAPVSPSQPAPGGQQMPQMMGGGPLAAIRQAAPTFRKGQGLLAEVGAAKHQQGMQIDQEQMPTAQTIPAYHALVSAGDPAMLAQLRGQITDRNSQRNRDATMDRFLMGQQGTQNRFNTAQQNTGDRAEQARTLRRQIAEQNHADKKAALRFTIDRYLRGNSNERKIGSLAARADQIADKLDDLENTDPQAVSEAMSVFATAKVPWLGKAASMSRAGALSEQGRLAYALYNDFLEVALPMMHGLRVTDTQKALSEAAHFPAAFENDPEVLSIVQQNRRRVIETGIAAGPVGEQENPYAPAQGQPVGANSKPVTPAAAVTAPAGSFAARFEEFKRKKAAQQTGAR